LLGREFVIRTYHKPLKHLLKQRLYTEAQHTWLLKLINYKYVVEYKKSKDNVAADSLSRREEIDSSLISVKESATSLTMVAVESNWLSKVKEMVETEDFFKNLKAD